MQVISVKPLPNQTLQAQIGSQSCTIDLAQNAYGLFFSLFVGQDQIIAGVICQNRNRLVRSLYLGFSGDFIFDDTQGSSDPVYTGLGTRYQLLYLDETDLPAGQG